MITHFQIGPRFVRSLSASSLSPPTRPSCTSRRGSASSSPSPRPFEWLSTFFRQSCCSSQCPSSAWSSWRRTSRDSFCWPSLPSSRPTLPSCRCHAGRRDSRPGLIFTAPSFGPARLLSLKKRTPFFWLRWWRHGLRQTRSGQAAFNWSLTSSSQLPSLPFFDTQ